MDEDQKTVDMFKNLSPADQEEIYKDSAFSLKLTHAVDRLESKKASGQVPYDEAAASPDVFPMTDGQYKDPKLAMDTQLKNDQRSTTNKIRSGVNGLTLGYAPDILSAMGENPTETKQNYKIAQDSEPIEYALGAAASPNPLGKLGAVGKMAGIGAQSFAMGQNNARLNGDPNSFHAGVDSATLGMLIQGALTQLIPESGGLVQLAAQKLKSASDSGLARFLGFDTAQIANLRASGGLEKLIDDATMARHGEAPILSAGANREGALTQSNLIAPHLGNEASKLDSQLPGLHTGEVADRLADASFPRVGMTSTEAPYVQQVMSDGSDYYRNMTPKDPENFQSLVPASVIRGEKSDAAAMMYPSNSSSLDAAMPANKGTNMGYSAKRQLFSDMHDELAQKAGLGQESALVNQNLENNFNIQSNLNKATDQRLDSNSVGGITTRLVNSLAGSRATSFVGMTAKKTAETILNNIANRAPDINSGPYIRALQSITQSSHPDVDMEIWRDTDQGFNRFINDAQANEGNK